MKSTELHTLELSTIERVQNCARLFHAGEFRRTLRYGHERGENAVTLDAGRAPVLSHRRVGHLIVFNMI